MRIDRRKHSVVVHNNIFLVGVVLFIYLISSVELYDGETDYKTKLDNVDAEENIRKLSEKTFKFKHWMIVPMLLGGLIKIAATIPLILAAATIIGTISLIGSKISLLISTIMAVRALLSPKMPEPKDPPPVLTADDLNDLQYLLAKNQGWTPSQQPSEIDYANYMKMAAAAPAPDPSAWNRKYINIPRYLYYPENYFSTVSPPDEGYGVKAEVNNQVIEETARVAGVHLANEMERAKGRNEKWIGYRNSGDKIKILAAAEMADRANDLLEKEVELNPNRRVGVRVIKTVSKIDQ